MMMEDSNPIEINVKEEQKHEQNEMIKQAGSVDNHNHNEIVEPQNQVTKEQGEIVEQNVEQLSQEPDKQDINEQKEVLQQATISIENIYRKKSQLLANLKLKTYDVNEDEDEPAECDSINQTNERVITIEVAHQQEQEQVVIVTAEKEEIRLRRRQQEISEEQLDRNEDNSDKQKDNVQIQHLQIQHHEVSIKDTKDKSDRVQIDQMEQKNYQQSLEVNVEQPIKSITVGNVVDEFKQQVEQECKQIKMEQRQQNHPQQEQQPQQDQSKLYQSKSQAEQQEQKQQIQKDTAKNNTKEHQNLKQQRQHQEQLDDEESDQNDQQVHQTTDQMLNQTNKVQQKQEALVNQELIEVSEKIQVREALEVIPIKQQEKQLINRSAPKQCDTDYQLNPSTINPINNQLSEQQQQQTISQKQQQITSKEQQQTNQIQQQQLIPQQQQQIPSTFQLQVTSKQQQKITGKQQKAENEPNDNNDHLEQNPSQEEHQQQQLQPQQRHNQIDSDEEKKQRQENNEHKEEIVYLEPEQESKNRQQTKDEVKEWNKQQQQHLKAHEIFQNPLSQIHQQSQKHEQQHQEQPQSYHEQHQFIQEVHVQQQTSHYEAVKQQQVAPTDQQVVVTDQRAAIKQEINNLSQKQNQLQTSSNNQESPLLQEAKISQSVIQQSPKPELNIHPVKPVSFKSRKIQKPSSQLSQPKQVVRNRSLHSLITTIHKTQQNLVKVPLHRPSHSQKKIRGTSPNLNRLKHNIGLDSKIIDLTVGEILEQRSRKNDQMKTMLLKEIDMLKGQIDLYQRDQEQQRVEGKRESFTQPVRDTQTSNCRQSINSKSKYQQPNTHHPTHRQQISSQIFSSSNTKKPTFYTPRGPKLPGIISPGQIPSFDYQKNIIQHSSLLNESPQRINGFLISSPQKRGNICGKIVRKHNHDTLRNSRINSAVKSQLDEFSRTVVNRSEESFVQEFSSNEVIESPSKVSQGSRVIERGSKKKIGSIISLREVSAKKKEQKETEVNTPAIEQLQIIPLPQKYQKQINFQALKNLPVKKLYISLNNQFNPIITKTLCLSFPTSSSPQEELVHFAHSVFFRFGTNIQSEDCLLNIKRYKNCIVFGLTSEETIIYHFEEKGRIYYGGWNGREKEGWGLEVTGEYVYKGEWKGNRKSGVGIMRVNKGSNPDENLTSNEANEDNQHKFVYYAGNWQHNFRHNFGIQLQSTRNHIIQYEGNWLTNKKTGQGTVTIHSRKSSSIIQTYTGDFLNGHKHGSGRETFANGDTYQGQYKQNKFDDKGKYMWRNGACYVGDFVQGLRDGKGQWFSDINDLEMIMGNANTSNGLKNKLNGDYYKGEYKNDKKNGFGIYRWKNGTIYEGEFQNDQKAGEGTLIVETQVNYHAKLNTLNSKHNG